MAGKRRDPRSSVKHPELYSAPRDGKVDLVAALRDH